eukprot:TRINITY_DN9367_c0_g1_i3.p1 TRINITY_DN9367_c0_g1~~TRINITY_DN9367_c0_g1_i3.p1  ORF type:complete len:164 (+),score=47.36 TRINITY_DN9367_c0_g1_i3:478-969(+)
MIQRPAQPTRTSPDPANVSQPARAPHSGIGLWEFYGVHNPEKATAEHVESTLARYVGREHVLVSKLRARYPSQQVQAAPEAEYQEAAVCGDVDQLLSELEEQLDECGEVYLQSAALGKTLEVYMKGGEYAIKAGSQLVHSCASIQEVGAYLERVPQMNTFVIR